MTDEIESGRVYHRPISVWVEEIQRMPDEKQLPSETHMTINLKFTHTAAIKMALHLLNELLVDEPLDYVLVEVTGPSR